MRARYIFAISATTLSIVGLNLALSNSGQSADRASRVGELLLAQAGPVLGAPGAQAPPALPTPVADDDDQDASPAGGEVQTRGPVHEAFARPVEMNAEPGPVIAKRPPDPIEEVPPDAAPEGENVQWISGYWAWDDDRNDFIWISGVFRNSPPRQTWVAGYWSEVPGGYQWTSGFWATPGGNGNGNGATNDAVQYIAEAPPQSLENGPPPNQPSENHFWVPGTWVYRQTRYAWQPGYWTPCQENWVFTPAQYVWTPAGYVFVPGYWDYAVARRGCLFAPVYFPQPVYVQPAYAYRPSVLINIGLFDDCLFVRPRYCHYYVGDYFAPSYATYGFRPWFSAGVRVGNVGIGINNGFGYDPLFVYANWHNSRNNRNWVADRQRHFDDLRDNPGRRPPQTFAAQQALIRKGGAGDHRDQQIAATIKQVEKDPSRGGVKMRDVSVADRQEFVKQSKDFKVVTQERAKLEKDNIVSGLVDGSGNARRNRTPDGNGKDGVAGNGNNDTPVNAKTLKLPTVAANKVNIGDVGGKNNSGNNTGDKAVLGNLPGSGNSSSGNSGNGNKLSNDTRRQGKGNNNDNDDDTSRTNRKSLTDGTKNPSGNGNKGVGNLGGVTSGNTGNTDSNSNTNTRSRLGTTGQGLSTGNSSNATGNGTLGQTQGGNSTTSQGGDSNSNSANRTRTRTGTGTTALGGNDNKSNNLGNNNPGNLGNNNAGGGNNSAGTTSTRRSTNPNTSGNGSNSGDGNNSGAGNSKSRTLGSTNSMTMPNGSNGLGQGNSLGNNPSGRSNVQTDNGNSGRSTRSLNGGGGGGDSNNQPTVRSINPGGGGGGNPGAPSGGGGGGGNASNANSGRSNSNSSSNSNGGGGGNSKSSQSKQDDDNNKRNNKRSENSPRTNMDLKPSSERALVDAGRGLAIERKALKDASSAGKDELAQLTKSPFAPNKDELNLDLPQERRKADSTASNGSSGAWRVPTLQTLNRGSAGSTASQSGSTGPSSDLSAGGDATGKNQTRGSGLTLKSAKDNAKANSDPSGGYAGGAGSGTQPGQGPALGGSKSAYDYQALAQRGQSISQNSGLAVGSNGGGSGSPLDRTTKDPVSKFGLGDRTMYGPGGLPGASSPSGDDSNRGSGSYMSSSSMPTLSKWQRSSRTGTVQSFDPSGSSRSYDPAAQSR